MSIQNNTNMAAIQAERAQLEASGRLHWVHWAVVLASLVLTIGAWSYARSQNNAQIRSNFEREVSQTVDLISERMQKYQDTLQSGIATIEANGGILTRSAWRTYSQSLHIEQTYPGIMGIGVILHVEPEELEAFTEEQRKDAPNFKVYPEHAQSEHYPITYIEPIETNFRALGLDVAHETNRYEAVKKARDTGQPQITGPIILVQDAKRTPGFLLYSPFYDNGIPGSVEERRSKFQGMVYAPFIFNKLMEGTLNAETRHVGLTIIDDGVVLFDENQADVPDYDANPLFVQKLKVAMNGREWGFTIRSAQSFRSANASGKPWMILVGGFFIDGLLLGLFLLLAKSNRKALGFAGRMAQAHKSNATRLNDIITSAVDGLMTISQTGLIESFNPACEDIFGFSAEDMLGQSINEIFDQKLNPDIANDYEFVSLLGKDMDVMGTRKDGTHIPLAVSVSEITIDDEVHYNAIIRDISERKAEEAVRLRLIEELEISNEDLEKFAYVASHDLKSPLRAIDNLSRWLEEDLGDELSKDNLMRFKLLRGRVSRMEGLLDALLDYSRAGHKTDPSQVVSVANLVNDIGNFLDIPLGFEIVADDSLNGVEMERMPLEQILNNLISNAIKHHDKSTGRIVVSVKETNRFYEFRVKDDGPGIPEEFHNKIFEMFQTLRRRDEVEGSGMGLALVKKVIYHNGGEIRVTSQAGRGSVFHFTLPKRMDLEDRLRDAL